MKASDRAAAGSAPAPRRRLLRHRDGQRGPHSRLRARWARRLVPGRDGRCHREPVRPVRAGRSGRRLVVGRHATRRDRSQSPHAPARHGRAGAGRRHCPAQALSFRHQGAGRAAPVRPPARDGAGLARAARRARAGTRRRPRGARRPEGSARAGERLRREDLAAPPRHPHGPACRSVEDRRPAQRNRRRRRPAACVRHPRPLARQQRRAACRTARRRARRGRRPVAEACAIASAPPGSTTSSPSRDRTSRSSPAAR